MLAGVREFLQSSKGKTIATAGAIIAIAIAAYAVISNLGSEAAALSSERWFVDSETGKQFSADLEAGMSIPIPAPSGKDTGYPAEKCFWTADGKTKPEPTYVLLNSWLGKPDPTFCPDCGRLVIGHNPEPLPGRKPPPTQAEFRQRVGGSFPR